jgi:hypothetical protein
MNMNTREAAWLNTREAAWQQGYDCYGQSGATRDTMAALWAHPKLIQDFCDGWDTAASEAEAGVQS